MPATSAGILLYRRDDRSPITLHVLLAHPGGPFWRNRDEGAWTIPKGLATPGEAHEDAARREFEEELGMPATGPLQALGGIRQRGGKQVVGFAMEGDFDPAALRSNTFEQEWPPRSGRAATFPEVDRAEWFPMEVARRKILPAQAPLLDRLAACLDPQH